MWPHLAALQRSWSRITAPAPSAADLGGRKVKASYTTPGRRAELTKSARAPRTAAAPVRRKSICPCTRRRRFHAVGSAPAGRLEQCCALRDSTRRTWLPRQQRVRSHVSRFARRLLVVPVRRVRSTFAFRACSLQRPIHIRTRVARPLHPWSAAPAPPTPETLPAWPAPSSSHDCHSSVADSLPRSRNEPRLSTSIAAERR